MPHRMEKQWDNAIAENWKNQLPPSRPTGAELVVFRRFIEQKKAQKGTPKILILGATPEFRDLIHEAGLTAYCVDYSRENYQAMELLKTRTGKEIFFHQNWAEMRFPEKFDLIFAEASLNAVSKDAVPEILDRIKKHLSDDGLFISKTWQRVPPAQVSLKKMVQEYREKHAHLNFKQAVTLPLYSYLYDEELNHLTLKKIFDAVKKYYTEGLINDDEFQSFCNLGYETTRHKLYFPLKDEFEALIADFSIVEVALPEPIGMNLIPTYVLRVKS